MVEISSSDDAVNGYHKGSMAKSPVSFGNFSGLVLKMSLVLMW